MLKCLVMYRYQNDASAARPSDDPIGCRLEPVFQNFGFTIYTSSTYHTQFQATAMLRRRKRRELHLHRK